MTEHADRDIDEIASEALDQHLDVSRALPSAPHGLDAIRRAEDMARARELLRDVSSEEPGTSTTSKFDAMIQHALDASGESTSIENTTALQETPNRAAVRRRRSPTLSSHRSAWIGAAAAIVVVIGAVWALGGRTMGGESADQHNTALAPPDATRSPAYTQSPDAGVAAESPNTGAEVERRNQTNDSAASSTTAAGVPPQSVDGESKDLVREPSAQAPVGSTTRGSVGLGESVRRGLLELIESALSGRR